MQDASTTERGAYTLGGVTTGGLDIDRTWGANYWIPSESEWYKAAFHQPSAEGGDADDFWTYPTRSNTPPGNMIGPLPLANHANLYAVNIGYSLTQSTSFLANQNYLTVGGVFEASGGPYGTFDQAGNVREWTDAVVDDTYRVRRGGFWSYILDPSLEASSKRNAWVPDQESPTVGFRVASR